jgi:hypothetical protein
VGGNSGVLAKVKSIPKVHFGVMSSLIECWQIEAFVQVDSKVL